MGVDKENEARKRASDLIDNEVSIIVLSHLNHMICKVLQSERNSQRKEKKKDREANLWDRQRRPGAVRQCRVWAPIESHAMYHASSQSYMQKNILYIYIYKAKTTKNAMRGIGAELPMTTSKNKKMKRSTEMRCDEMRCDEMGWDRSNIRSFKKQKENKGKTKAKDIKVEGGREPQRSCRAWDRGALRCSESASHRRSFSDESPPTWASHCTPNTMQIDKWYYLK